MKKKLLSFILAFLLCVSLIPAALADSDKSIVYDREGLFDEFDTEIISGKLAELNRIYGVDVAVVTASAEEYADDFYDENEIGQGENKDGILLLISESERVWAISTSGSCIDAFTDSDLDYIAENLLDYLSDEDWSGAATAARACPPMSRMTAITAMTQTTITTTRRASCILIKFGLSAHLLWDLSLPLSSRFQ